MDHGQAREGQDVSGKFDPALLVEVIRGWRELVKQAPPTVEPGSDLYSDGLASPVHQVAHASWAGIVSAVDPLDAMQTLLTRARVVHTYAPYTLIRAAMENAAVAMWLLGPEDQATRLTRVLHLTYENLRQDERAGDVHPRALPRHPPMEERRREVEDLALSLGLDLALIRGRFGYGRVVRRAAEHAGVSPDMTVYLWSVCSGHAHGRQWASLHMLKRDLQPSGVEGVKTVRFTTDFRQVTTVAGAAVALNNEALRLYERRRSA